jgi:hypothetical protein
MRIGRALLWLSGAALCTVTASPAVAQPSFGSYSTSATGETYKLEVGATLFNPTPTLIFSSEQFGIPGSRIDFVDDLGGEKKRLWELRAVFRPGRKHKIRVHYLPADYSSDSILQRTVVFNGIVYEAGLPVQSEIDWDTLRVGYEYDFIYRDRGFVGFIVELKQTWTKAQLDSPIASEFAEATAPIPALGAIARVYVAPNISITGEATGMRIPDSVDEDWRVIYFDYDVYGTVNITDRFGAQLGYRSIDVSYDIDFDSGDLTLEGVYFGGVVRF